MSGKSGVPTVVVQGRRAGVLAAALAGDDLGTLFVPSADRLTSRKQWIAYGARPAGALVVDAGAHRALVAQGRSLLPKGIVEVRGGFALGDLVSLVGPEGREFARGLTSYGADELRRIQGRHSADILATLGYKYVDEAIHRDDLVIL
jgi:glutamate 5-kinase